MPSFRLPGRRQSSPDSPDDSDVVSASVRETIEHLATLLRSPGSPGEADAAAWLAERLSAHGATAQVESASFQDGYAKVIGALTALSTAGGLLAFLRLRKLGALAAAAAAGLIADDVSNGPRLVRSLAVPVPTQNVVAEAGDPEAERTLVIFGHHDAAPTGLVFDQSAQTWAGKTFPGLLERFDTSLPLWWLVLSAPLLTAWGALARRRGVLALGAGLSAVGTAAFADIFSSETVPGANDNLSALGVLVGLAERLAEQPVQGVRVLLVSCGAEEVIQGGIYSFADRHFPELDPASTYFLCVDTVGSPQLVLLEGEGAVVMEDYHFRPFRDLVARVADQAGAPLVRGLRSRNSTDAVIPSRAGYPTATLTSFNRQKALSNYHLPTDTPENLDWQTIAQTLVVSEAVVRELASNPWL
ncbi:MAG: M28 family peptidase [Solirubrobacterales bacterium]|nr:M28 family peptidase [Solirubrobacterales bacterium]